jgi:hypothetical protein
MRLTVRYSMLYTLSNTRVYFGTSDWDIRQLSGFRRAVYRLQSNTIVKPCRATIEFDVKCLSRGRDRCGSRQFCAGKK